MTSLQSNHEMAPTALTGARPPVGAAHLWRSADKNSDVRNHRLLIGMLALSASLVGCRTVSDPGTQAHALAPVFLSDTYGEPRVGTPGDDPVPALPYPAPSLEGVSEISLQRTGCLGSCPAYQVTFKSDGTAAYWGGEYAVRQGNFHASAPDRLNLLVAWARALGILDLNPTYSFVTVDAPDFYVAFVLNGKQKILFDPGGKGPVPLYAFELMIDSVVRDLDWQPTSKRAR